MFSYLGGFQALFHHKVGKKPPIFFSQHNTTNKTFYTNFYLLLFFAEGNQQTYDDLHPLITDDEDAQAPADKPQQGHYISNQTIFVFFPSTIKIHLQPSCVSLLGGTDDATQPQVAPTADSTQQGNSFLTKKQLLFDCYIRPLTITLISFFSIQANLGKGRNKRWGSQGDQGSRARTETQRPVSLPVHLTT